MDMLLVSFNFLVPSLGFFKYIMIIHADDICHREVKSLQVWEIWEDPRPDLQKQSNRMITL